MGIGMSQEECDNSCDREIRMYQKNEERCRFDKKELKMDNEKYKEEIDELTDKFNDFEAECKKEVNKYKNKRVMAEARNGNNIRSELQNVTSLSGGNSGLVSKIKYEYKPPSEIQIEEYKLSKRLQKCKDLSGNSKVVCYDRIKEGFTGIRANRRVEPINLDLIKNGIMSDKITYLERCYSKGITKNFCYGRMEKKPIPNIVFTDEYFNKYKHLFEGFDNLDSNKENNNDNFLLILVMSIIVLLYICK
tara:strand:+ start:246 stop:989 length:744 start_codon:yes stop_codon:yes gene_type:complete